MMHQIVAPWLFRGVEIRIQPKNGGNARVMPFDSGCRLKSSLRKMSDPSQDDGAKRDPNKGAGFSPLSELDRAIAMLLS